MPIHGRSRRDADRIRIAAAIQQEILVPHVGEPFWVEGHSHKVEVGIEAMNLHGHVDVVACAAVAVVVEVLVTSLVGKVSIRSRQRCGTQDVGARGGGGVGGATATIRETWEARGPQIFLLILGRYVNVSPRDRSVLTGTYVELPDHAHLQVLGRRDVTVPEVGPRV